MNKPIAYKIRRIFTRSAIALALGLAPAAAPAQDPPAGSSPAVVAFDRDVQPILRKRCGACHNAERPRGDLDLTRLEALTAGGAGGPVAVLGQAADSPLYTYMAHLEEPRMPPNAPKIPQREIDTIRAWIDGGMRASATDAAAQSAGSTSTAPAGLAAPRTMPRATPITALAVSPTAPLAAVAGLEQVLVFDLETRRLLGAVPFPEGDVLALRFARDGKTLLAAGGVGATSGQVAVVSVGDWTRRATLGDAPDVLLAADLAPDGATVVVGGPTRVVTLLAHPSGAPLHTLRKPTDWVTAAAFSPDGLLVAAGDRFGGLFL